MTWTMLHDAAVHLDTRHMMDLVQEDAGQAFQVDDHGWNALAIFVVQLGFARLEPSALDAVRALLQASPQSVSDTDVHGNTPLHLLVASLVSVSEPVQTTDFALAILQLFMDACPVALSIKNLEGLMPLHMACRFFRTDSEISSQVIARLVSAYPYALLSPIKIGTLAKPRRPTTTTDPPHWNPSDITHLPTTVEQQFETFRQQIRDGAYPLHMALAAGAPLHIIDVLVQEGPEVLEQTNKFGATPLHVALAHRAPDAVVDCLLQRDVRHRALHTDGDGDFPMHTAARAGCTLHVAQCLLDPCPEQVRARNGAGWTPLELAVEYGNCSEEVLQYFQEIAESII